ncbi:MAG: hypothetical protein IPK32_07060 [Verrucomicrobiaceae bacterium]|nr:hypothetical protein [Verrucomicrobiaceae bacterium]
MNTPAEPQSVDSIKDLPLEEQLVGVNAKTGPYLQAGRSLRRVKGFQAQTNCFHVMSRTCGGAVFWDDVEKEALRRVLWRLAEFCGVRLMTYCVMGNHFHALVEVPDQKRWVDEQFGGPQGEERLMRHLRVLYSKVFVEQLQEEFAELRKRGSEAVVQHRLGLLKRRFCDVAVFVKEVKQRFSRWYNKRHKRKGTLWMDRYRSVLVEGKGNPLLAMAAYIDLNPVRGGLVTDPKDYRWCGYAEALGGNKECQRGICRVTGRDAAETDWVKSGAREGYRQMLFSIGREVKAADGKALARRGVSGERAEEVLEQRGKLSLGELVRMRVRHFTDGAVIGSKAFVNEFFDEHKERFGVRRKDGARRIREVDGDLHSLRDLKRQVLHDSK